MAKILTDRQKLFIQEYLIDLNATAAAIRAGYSVRNASKIGHQQIHKPAVREAIEKEQAEISRRTGISVDRVVKELARVALVNPPDVIDLDEATVKDASRDDTAAILSVKVKRIPTEDGDIVEREVKMADKIKALELLGKHLGMFKNELPFKDAIPIRIVDDIE